MEKFEPIKVLGEGAFGKVHLMRHRLERKLVCIKVVRIKNLPKKEREACRMEVELMRRLNHPNIVGYLGSFMHRSNESLCIVMQYCDGGDLCARIKAANKQLFPESKILHWFVQMALGLYYMHENRVLHRDLKTQNIFMLGNGRLVLGDLGISKVRGGAPRSCQGLGNEARGVGLARWNTRPARYERKEFVWRHDLDSSMENGKFGCQHTKASHTTLLVFALCLMPQIHA